MKFNGGSCYPWAGYSSGDYMVEKGTVHGMEAYNVHPPQSVATSFVAGGTGVYFHFSQQIDYNIFSLEEGSLVKVGAVLASEVTDGFTKTSVRVHGLSVATAYLFLPAD